MKTVLVVEDDEDEVFLMRQACKAITIRHSLHVAADGQEAIDYLAGTGVYEDRARYPLPDLVFLDIDLPRRTGHEVLEWIRGQPTFKYLPVVMLTNLAQPEDKKRAYDLGAMSYFEKNSNCVEFNKGIQTIFHYWLKLNLLPE